MAKVGDFGLSRTIGTDGNSLNAYDSDGANVTAAAATTGRNPIGRTLTPSAIGTAAYSAPELLQLESDEVQRDDSGGVANSGVHVERILKADVSPQRRTR